MAYYLVKQDDGSEVLIGFFIVLGILGGICMCIQRLLETITPYVLFAWKWLISFHFNNIWECLFHFYVWLFYVPVLTIAAAAVGSILFCVGGGIWGGYKLTAMMNFGTDWVAWVLKLVIGLVLCFIGLLLGGALSGFLIGGPALFLLSLVWLGITFFKDKCLRLTWMNDVFFAFLLYGIIPGSLLTLLLLSK